MLDLKAKLASAGLVTDKDIKRVEDQQKKRKRKPKGKSGHKRKRDTAGLPLDSLRDKPKGEIYDGVRRWIEKARLDATGLPTETSKAYHFPTANGRAGRLMLEPELIDQLQKGEVGLIAYMSNHGLAHAVVPAAGATAVAELMPFWLRVLVGDPRAGKQQEAPAPKTATNKTQS